MAHRTNVFKDHDYRMKHRDSQALEVTRKNIQKLAVATNGAASQVMGVWMLSFIGLSGPEFAFEGEWLVRVMMPNEEFFTAMSPEKFRDTYEKVEKR